MGGRLEVTEKGRTSPSQRRWLSMGMRVLNVLPKLILRSRLHGVMSGNLMLLEFDGRASGRRYVVPVSYAESEGAIIIGTDRPWRKNIHGGDPLSVWLYGRRRGVRAEIVDEDAEMTTLFGGMIRKNPPLGRFQDIRIEPDGRANEGDMRRAVERGVAVIRLHPERDEEVA